MSSQVCFDPECSVNFGFFDHKYQCSGCGEYFCDDHCCNVSYLTHLTGERIDRAKKEKGYLCSACLAKDGFADEKWQRCLIDRKCFQDRCTTSLNDLTTYKSSCVVCGRWFCNSHTISKASFSKTWLKRNTRYPEADAVCKNCGQEEASGLLEEMVKPVTDPLRATGSEFIEKINQSIETLQERYDGIKKELRNKSIIFGLRASLAALACSFLVFFTPNLRDVFQSGEMFSFAGLWSLFGILAAVVFLSKEFIIPGLRLKEARVYAWAMIAGALFTVVGMFL